MKDILSAIFRHRGKASIFFVLVMAGTILVTALLPKKYQSEAKLFLRVGRENATLDPTVTLGEQSIVAIPQSRENEINSVAEMLQSRMLLEKVANKLGPAAVLQEDETAEISADKNTAESKLPAHAGNVSQNGESKRNDLAGKFKDGVKTILGMPLMSEDERALQQIQKNLRVEPARKSDVIEIAYLGGSPRSAQAVVATVIDIYLDEHVRLNRPQGSHEFFIQQTKRLQTDLSDKEQSLRDLKNSTGLSSLDDRRHQLITRIGRLEDDLLQADTARAISEAKVQALKQKLIELPNTQITQEISGFGDEGTDRMRDQLYALHIREKAAAAKYTTDHPLLQEIRDQIKQAKEVLNQEQRTRTQVMKEPGKLYHQAQMDLLAEEPILASLNASTKELSAQLASARNELKEFNGNELRVADLQREVDLLDNEYRKYSASLEQARIDGALEYQKMSNINVAEGATLEPMPVSPRLKVNLLLGMGVGLFGAIGLCLFWDRFNHSVHTPLDIENNLDLPTLVVIPRLKFKQPAVNGRR
jgi:polysaccharide biosynthesis protein PslE